MVIGFAQSVFITNDAFAIPALPGCVTFGSTRELALERIQEAIEGHLEALKDAGLAMPNSDIEVAEVQVNYA